MIVCSKLESLVLGMYLQKINFRPNTDALSDRERQYLQNHYDYNSTELFVHGNAIAWDAVEEVELVIAARLSGAGGMLTRLLMGGDRYHVGIYFGKREAVLPNISLTTAKYILQTIAYNAPFPVRYNGPNDLVAVADE